MNNALSRRPAAAPEEQQQDTTVVRGQPRRRNRTLEQAVKLLEALQMAAALT
jgi:hypothetical protein